MTRDELVTLLGYRLNRTDLDAKIILEMSYVQQFKLEGTGAFLPWFLETEWATASLTSGEERLAFPTDFLAEVENEHLWLYDETNEDAPYTKLKKDDYDYLLEKYQAAGTPAAYAVGGEYYLIKPTPDDTYTFKMRYYAKDDLPSASTENKWLKHASDLFMAEVGTIMAEKHLRNLDLAAGFKQDATEARQRLYTKHEARQHVNRYYQMGED